MTSFNISKDAFYNSLINLDQLKIPRYPNIAAAGDAQGLEGNLILETSTGTFYGHDGTQWVPFGGGGVNDCECEFFAAPPTDTVQIRPRTSLLPLNIGMAMTPRGTGAFTAQVPDAAVSGGDSRGEYAVDLQMARGFAKRVAAADHSVICGGESNGVADTATHSSIGGGRGNRIGELGLTGNFSHIGGGYVCLAGGSFNFIGSGKANAVLETVANSCDYSGIVCGSYNAHQNSKSCLIGSGNRNYVIDSSNSLIGGGGQNEIGKGGTVDYGAIIGGKNNTISGCTGSVIIGGSGNDIPATLKSSDFSLIGGGEDNEVYEGDHCAIICGKENKIDGNYNSIIGGLGNDITDSSHSVIINGTNHIIDSRSNCAIIAAPTGTGITDINNAMLTGTFRNLGGFQTQGFRTVTSSTTALVSETVIFGDTTLGTFSIQLPVAASATGQHYWIKNSGTGGNNLAISAPTVPIFSANIADSNTGHFFFDGTNWHLF